MILRVLGALTYAASVVAGTFFILGNSPSANTYIDNIVVWHSILIAGSVLAVTGIAFRSHRLEAGGCSGLVAAYAAYAYALGLQAADTGAPTLVGLGGMISTLVGLLLLRIGALMQSIRVVAKIEAEGVPDAG